MADDTERLALDLNYWDDTVGVFEPAKGLRQLQRSFPATEIDPTDHQRVRLLRELENWTKLVADTSQRDSMVRQSWGLYQRMGPTYRFVVPFPSGHRVSGGARRSSVYFYVPPDLPTEYRDQLLAFLSTLRLGQPTLSTAQEDAEPTAVVQPLQDDTEELI